MLRIQGILSSAKFRLLETRCISTHAKLYTEVKPEESKDSEGKEKISGHAPNTVDKFCLVWTKKYPSFKEIPAYVPYDLMEKARNISRIRLNLLMCAITIVVCLCMALLGRRAAHRGENITQRNIDWHKEQSKN